MNDNIRINFVHLLTGPGTTDLQSSLTDVELMRFAKDLNYAKDSYIALAAELGVTGSLIDKIEHDHSTDLVMKTFTILTTWMEVSEKRTCKVLLAAVRQTPAMTTGDHIICKVSCKVYNMKKLNLLVPQWQCISSFVFCIWKSERRLVLILSLTLNV